MSQTQTAYSPPTEAAAPPGAPDWLDHYLPAPGRHDECKDAFGAIRPHWEKLASLLGSLPHAELERRSESLRRLIQENGITYNVFGAEGDRARPWAMDLLPLLLAWDEWRTLENGLRQRVHLLNLVLQDLYGPQTLIEQRILPAQLVLGNPAFLRPAHGFTPPDGAFVQFYGADLARAPDGQWWVLSDRLDAPSGLGYALENRALATRVHADWLRELGVQRLDGFFQSLRTVFERLVARRTENPRVVLLTPGPANETYFEHSYLARSQGYALVEGDDLTVRGSRVYLKTLSGLRPVDLIVRRVDADFCDPVELRRDSLLGVPGMLQAARAGQVTIANALGAGLLESPGIAPFLPALCRHLLGEDLILPSVATWWCGQPRELAYVLDNLEGLLIQPAFPADARALVAGPLLGATDRERWRARLRAEPWAWCARERVALATAPLYDAGRIEPRLFHLRTFLMADGGEYHAMPGGFARATASATDLDVSMRHGGRSKDAWVLPPTTHGSPAELSTATPAPTVRLRRQTPDLPSRVADNLFWFGRYLERAEGQARLLRLLVDTLTAEGAAASPGVVRPFFLALCAPAPAPGAVTLNIAAAEHELSALLWDESLEHSFAASLARLEAVSYRAKERLSSDAWSLVGRLRRQHGAEPRSAALTSDTFARLAEVNALLSALGGLVAENMTRGPAWRLLELGRRLERGSHLASLFLSAFTLQSASPNPPPALLQHLLVSCDSLLTYRRRYLTNLQLAPVLDLLVLDDDVPRSLAFQVKSVRKHVEALPRPAPAEPPGLPKRLALSLYSRTHLADARALAQTDERGARPALEDFLHHAAGDFAALSDALGQVYFAHADITARD